jgi:hypothetical protein
VRTPYPGKRKNNQDYIKGTVRYNKGLADPCDVAVSACSQTGIVTPEVRELGSTLEQQCEEESYHPKDCQTQHSVDQVIEKAGFMDCEDSRVEQKYAELDASQGDGLQEIVDPLNLYLCFSSDNAEDELLRLYLSGHRKLGKHFFTRVSWAQLRGRVSQSVTVDSWSSSGLCSGRVLATYRQA